MSNAIDIVGVAKRYATALTALQDVSVRIGPGQFVALLGASGCGKSTLLRLVAGLEAPSAGTIRIDAPAGTPPVLSYVFQEATLMPWASVRDNVALPLRISGQAPGLIHAAVDAALGGVGLAERGDAFPDELSGGMRMRVSIARAMVTRPAVLLLDEPFAALDEITRQRLNDDLLAQWAARSPTALFVTHSVVEAVYLSQRVLVMGARPGRIVADLPIDLPYPRDPALRLEGSFLEHCRAVSGALAGALAPADAPPLSA